MFGAIAEFERGLIQERTYAGLASARARGRVGGRKKSLNEVKTKALQRLYNSKEHSIGELCEMFENSNLRFTAI